MVSRKYRRKNRTYPLEGCSHICICGNHLIYNVSMDNILHCEDPDNNEDTYINSRVRDADMALIQVNAFGANRLYKLIDPKKLRDYNKAANEYLEEGRDYSLETPRFISLDNPTQVSAFFWSLMDIDTAPAMGINVHSQVINVKRIFTAEQALQFTIQHNIALGLNKFYEQNGMPTRATMGFSQYNFHENGEELFDEYGCAVSELDERAQYGAHRVEASELLAGEVDFNSVIPDFSPEGYTPGKYKYIVDLPYSYTKFSNNVMTGSFNHLFIYIPEFDLWQELRNDEISVLQRLHVGKITYSRVDDPHCFSRVYYSSEFSMDSLETTLFNAIAIPADMKWHSMFLWQRTDCTDRHYYKDPTSGEETRARSPYDKDEYEALTFDLQCYQYNLNLTLTQEELGIGNNAHYKNLETDMHDLPGYYHYRNSDFWMLGLLIQILNLRPSLGDRFLDGNFND